MTGTADDLARIEDAARQLRALDARFRRARADYRRGGFPASSMNPGSRSGAVDSPMLEHDPLDRRLNADTKRYVTTVRAVAAQLDVVVRMLQAWTIVADPLPEPDPEPCASLECDRVVTNLGSDRLKRLGSDGPRLCPSCYMDAWRARRRT